MGKGSEFVDAGALRERSAVLELRETEEGWAWAQARRTWMSAEAGTGRNLFSAVGVGARDYSLVLRRQRLTLHNAIAWRGRHLFLTSITPRGRGHLEVHAALVPTADVVCRRTGRRFPAVLTEKWSGYQREDSHGETNMGFVFVTPKAVTLRVGDLLTSGGRVYAVETAHELDEYKNEYEAAWRGDA